MISAERTFFLLLLLLLSLTTIVASAQTRGIFLEAGGSGGLGSVNYEKWIPLKPHRHTGFFGHDCPDPVFRYTLRAGLGFSPIDKNNGSVIVVPLMANVILGREADRHRLEIGAGVAPSITTKGGWFIKSPLFIGYRWNPNDRRLFVRAGYAPIVAWLVDFQWQHWAGVSIGYHLQ